MKSKQRVDFCLCSGHNITMASSKCCNYEHGTNTTAISVLTTFSALILVIVPQICSTNISLVWPAR